MLLFNPNPVIRLRNISGPRTFLVGLGINPVTASKMLKGKSSFVKVHHLEAICKALNCTPDTLFEWHPNASDRLPEGHRLTELRSGGELARVFETLNTMSPEEIERLVREARKEG